MLGATNALKVSECLSSQTCVPPPLLRQALGLMVSFLYMMSLARQEFLLPSAAPCHFQGVHVRECKCCVCMCVYVCVCVCNV